MKKLFNILKVICVILLVSPLALSWLPSEYFAKIVPERIVESGFFASFFSSFRELSISLTATLLFAMLLSFILGYISVLNMRIGRGFANILNAVESIPAILVALFCKRGIDDYVAYGIRACSDGNHAARGRTEHRDSAYRLVQQKVQFVVPFVRVPQNAHSRDPYGHRLDAQYLPPCRSGHFA